MKWRRGLFRLWIVGTALFVLAIAFISYSVIEEQFEETALQHYLEANVDLLVPQLCGQARGVAGTDYSTQQARNPGPWDTYSKPNPFDIVGTRCPSSDHSSLNTMTSQTGNSRANFMLTMACRPASFQTHG